MTIDRETPDMNLARFADLTDAYGADPDRWPAGERGAAEAFLARSVEARRLRDTAARLDGALAVVQAPMASAALRARLMAAAAPQPPRGVLMWIMAQPVLRPIMLTAVGVLGLYLGMASGTLTAAADEEDAVEFEIVAGGSAPGGIVDFLEAQ